MATKWDGSFDDVVDSLSGDTAWDDGGSMHAPVQAQIDAEKIADRAKLELEADPDDLYVRWPLEALDALLGGMGEGQVHYPHAYSENGKTTFCLSMAEYWAARGERPYVISTETERVTVEKILACHATGAPVQDVLSGRYHLIPDWRHVRDALIGTIEQRRQAVVAGEPAVYLGPSRVVTEGALASEFRDAQRLGCRIVIIDHIDFLEDLGESQRVNRYVLKAALSWGLRVVASGQLNQGHVGEVRQDPLSKYLPPAESSIKFGSHKRENATTMFGLYRPLREDLTSDVLKEIRDRKRDAVEALAPGQMGVQILKHRILPASSGRRCILGVENGRVVPLSERDRYTTVAHHWR